MRRFFLLSFAVAMLAALESCGGGGGGSTGGSNPIPVGAATPCPANYLGPPPNCVLPAQTGTASFTTSPAGTQVTLPSVGGFTGTLILPAANASVAATLYVSISPQPGVPPISVMKTYLYFDMHASAAVTLTGDIVLDVTPPATNSPGSLPLYVAALNPDGVWSTLMGPAGQSGSEYSLGQPVTVQFPRASDVAFVLYTGSYLYGGAPLQAIPNQVLVAPGQTQSITVQGPNSTASVIINSTSCAGIANVTNGTPGTYSVVGTALGTCSLAITDNWGNSLNVPVSVTAAQVIVQ